MTNDLGEQLQQYLSSLGVVFGDRYDADLLVRAFTHSSYSADFVERPRDNERLEFLGDAVLGRCISTSLFQDNPDTPESQLTLSKIYLVKETTLAEVARDIGLGKRLILGKGEISQGGREKDSVLSDTLEAVIAYLYLDLGVEQVQRFVHEYIYSKLDGLTEVPGKSAKSRLQEYVQKKYKEIPSYVDTPEELDASGQVALYQSVVCIQGKEMARGVGPSKKKAQETAAAQALQSLDLE